MGEAFRGLTIKFGADASQLDSTLSAMSRSVRSTEGHLRNLQKAMRLDPSSMAALSQHLKESQHKIDDLAGKATLLGEKIRRIEGDREFRAMAAETSNFAAKAADAQVALARVEHEMASLNDEFIKYREANDSTWSAAKRTREQATAEAREFAAMHTAVNDKLFEQLTSYKMLDQQMHRYLTTLSAANKGMDWQKQRSELQAVVAEEAKLIKETQRLAYEQGAGSRSAQAVYASKKALEATGQAAKALDAELRGVNDALSNIGRDKGLQKTKINIIIEQAKVAQVRVGELKAAMSRLETAGASTAGKSMMQLQEETRKAADEADRLAKKQAELAAEARVAEQELARVKADAALDPNVSTAQYVVQLGRAERALKAVRVEAKAASAALDTARSNEELRRMQTELKQTEAAARSLRSQLTGATGLNTSSLRSLGVSMSATITPAVMIAGSTAIQAAEDIDSAFRDMKKTVDGTEEQFQRLRDAAIEYSKVHVTSADTILEIQAMGGQLGIAVEDLEAFATTVSNLDIATNMDADTIAVSLGKLGSVLGLTADEYDNFGDALVRLGNNMPALEGDVMNITTRWAGMGKIVGMSADQILAWSTAATATGQKAEAAGSAMQRMVSNIETAVTAGGKKLDEYARVAGMTSEQFRDLFHEDASTAMYAFIRGLGEMQKSGASVNQELAKLGIANVRDKQLMEGLAQQMANAGDGASILSESLQMSRDAFNGISDAWGAAGDAAREAEKKSEGFSGTLGKLRNTAAALGDTVGQALVPDMEWLSGILNSLESIIRSMTPETQQLLVHLAAGLALAGPALNFLSSAWRVVKSLGGGLGTLVTAMKAGTKAAGGLRAVFAAMGGPVKLVATILAGIALPAVADFVKQTADAAARAERQQAAMSTAATAAEGYAGALRRVGDAQATVAQDGGGIVATADEVMGRLQERAEAITGIYEEAARGVIGADARGSVAQGYLDVMNELAGHVDGNSEKMSRLKAAVDGYNAVTGASVTITDQYSGALSDTEESMYGLIEAMKARAKVQAYQGMLTGLYGEKVKIQAEADEAYEAWRTAQNELTDKISRAVREDREKHKQDFELAAYEATGTTDTTDPDYIREYNAAMDARARVVAATFSEEQAAVDGLKDTYEGYGDTMQGVDDTIDRTVAAMEAEGVAVDEATGQVSGATQEMQTYVESILGASDGMEEGAISAEAVAQSLEDVGVVLANLKDLDTDTQLAFIEALAENGGDVEAACEEIGISLSDLGVEAEAAFERMGRGTVHFEDLAAALLEVSERAPDTTGAVQEAFDAFEAGEISAEECAEAIETALNDAGIAVENLTPEMVAMAYASEESAEGVVAAFQAVADAAEQAKIEAEQLDKARETVKGFAESMDKITDASPALRRALAGAGVDAHELGWLLESAGLAVEDFGETWERVSGITSLTSPFEWKQRGEATTTSSIRENLEGQLNAARLYEKAMTSLYSQVADAADLAYVDALGQLSMEDLLTVLWQAGMDENGNVELPDVELHANAQLFADVNDAEAQASLNITLSRLQQYLDQGMEDSRFHYDQELQQFTVVTEDGYTAIITGLEMLNGQVVATLDDGSTQVIAEAGEIPQDVADGIEANADKAADGGSHIANALVGAMGDLNSEMEERGRLAATNMAYGFEHADMSAASKNLASSLLGEGFEDDGSLSGFGADMAAAVAAGIEGADLSSVEFSGLLIASTYARGVFSGVEPVKVTAAQLVQAVTDALSAPAAEGAADPYMTGFLVGADFAVGLAGAQSAVDATVRNLRTSIYTGVGVLAARGGVMHGFGAVAAQELIDGMEAADTSGLTGLGEGWGQDVSDGVGSKSGEMTNAANTLIGGLAEGFALLGQSMYGIGSNGSGQLKAGLDSNIENVRSSATALTEAVNTQIAALTNPATGLMAKGRSAGLDLANGLSYATSAVETAAFNLAAVIGAQFYLLQDSAYTWGKNAGDNLGAGLLSTVDAVGAAANAVAAAAAVPLHHSTPKEGPLHGDDKWGSEMGGMIAEGLRSSVSDVRRSAYEVADAAANVRRGGAAALGAGGTETNYNIWFNGTRVNDDAAMRAAVINVVSEAVRKGGN